MRVKAACVVCVIHLTIALCSTRPSHAADPGPTTVPPTLEIEVLDPGVDPLGNPAVFVQSDESGQLQVDIPPVVLVHRYYYSGNRSFQAQMLPGGPSIVVCNHPKTGERCYIPVQMMPGAPRVTYTSHTIDYDYGEHGIAVCFGLFGHPSVKYRNGQPWRRKIGTVVHAEQWKGHANQLKDYSKTACSRSKTLASGTAAYVSDAGKTIVLPVQNLVQLMPFGKTVFGTDWEERLATRAAEHKRDKGIQHLEKDRRWSEYSIPTNR